MPWPSGLEISQNRHLPCIKNLFGIYGKIINLHWKSSKVSLALQPEALVNTSGRVDFSSPAVGSIKVEVEENNIGADQPAYPRSLVSIIVMNSLIGAYHI